MAVTYPEFLAVMAGNLFMVLPSMSLDWTIRLFSELDTESSNTINSFRIAGNLIGVVIFSTISHFLGRRIALISGGLSLPVGIFIITLSGKKEILYYGHSVVGLSVGGVAAVLPIYLGEIAKKKSRGILQSTILLSSTIGEFLSLCIVQFSSYQVHKLLLVVTPLLCSVIFFVLGIETPHFHVKNNRENIAKAVLVKLRESYPS
ncbi:hypothetical protein JTB14_031652 [Gonioctena quinquepunctata]|nr:hypothetical protein JTB14_031652 [Gonioctena quinquepunctata]